MLEFVGHDRITDALERATDKAFEATAETELTSPWLSDSQGLDLFCLAYFRLSLPVRRALGLSYPPWFVLK